MKRRKLNTGGVAAAAMAIVDCDAIYRYDSTNFGFPAFCWAFMDLMGGLAWISFRRFGLWLNCGSR